MGRPGEPIDLTVADALVTHGVNLLRYTAGLQGRALALLEALEAALVAQLIAQGLNDLGDRARDALLKDAAERIEQAYAEISGLIDGELHGLAAAEAAAVMQALSAGLAQQTPTTIRISLAPGKPSQRVLDALVKNVLIEGAPSRELWAMSSEYTRFQFASAVRQGMAAGETVGTIAKRITGTPDQPGVMDIARSSARKLVQQSVMTVSAEARMASFEENEDLIKGVMQVSTLDGRTSNICVAYSGGMWDLKTKQPMNGTTLPFINPTGSPRGVPRHWNCRSVLVPVTKTFREMGIDLDEPEIGTRASVDGQVSANLSFNDWLNNKPVAFQDELLGKGRAQLWRDRKITLSQLLDQRGNELSLDELRRLYE